LSCFWKSGGKRALKWPLHIGDPLSEGVFPEPVGRESQKEGGAKKTEGKELKKKAHYYVSEGEEVAPQ